MKILTINIPETEGYFPLSANLYDLPFEVSVSRDAVYGVPIPDDDRWREMNDTIDDSTPIAKFIVEGSLPEWVELGREYIKANAPDGFDEQLCDDEVCAATYIHSELLRLTGAVAVYSTIW